MQHQNAKVVSKKASKGIKSMQDNFCTHCGTPLEPGALFCEECGRSTSNDAAATGQLAPNLHAAPPYQDFVPQNTVQSKEGAPKRGGGKIIVISVLIALLIIIVGIALLLFLIKPNIPFLAGTPFSSAGSAADVSASVQNYDSDRNQRGTTIDEEEEREEIELTFYEVLNNYYYYLYDYEAEVEQCLDDLNNNYDLSSLAKRRQFYNYCSAVKGQLKDNLIALEQLSVPSDSAHKNTYDDLCKLYELLIGEVEIIESAWTVSLCFEDPSNADVASILETTVADAAAGIDSMETLYHSIFPKAKPVEQVDEL